MDSHQRITVSEFDKTKQKKMRNYLPVDAGDCQSSAGLAVNQLTKLSFTLDNAVWDAHLLAQGW